MFAEPDRLTSIVSLLQYGNSVCYGQLGNGTLVLFFMAFLASFLKSGNTWKSAFTTTAWLTFALATIWWVFEIVSGYTVLFILTAAALSSASHIVDKQSV